MDDPAPSTADAAFDAIAAAAHGDPFAVLGPHDGQVRAFLPQAQRAWVADIDGDPQAEMVRVHPDGLYEGPLGDLAASDYRLLIEAGGDQDLIDDAYRFGPVLGELDVYLLAQGRHQQIHEALGGHPTDHQGSYGARFALWAPNARRVSVVGDFNAWDGRRHPMRRRLECGVWELFIPGLSAGQRYKYEILGADGALQPLKADPMARAAEHPPATASILCALPCDGPDPAWVKDRRRRNAPDAPISIYEVHLGSWMRGEDNRYLSYQALGDRLIPYAVSMGFTHLEFLPISEHPFDGSWGYQPLGLYAPTSRHGSPEEFARLVRRAHEAGLGVILDWVPGHFPSDPHGLAHFDGTHLYEHADPRQGFHLDWNTLIYNFGRAEVRNFLAANARFWLDVYAVDGLRVDAVASMLYLDYSRAEGEWVPNRYGGRENLEAIDFLREVNDLAHADGSGVATIAEESTAWPGVSKPVDQGGLGFDYKWNMGWMHDTLSYIARDPIHRHHHHDEMTFGLVYAFSERFILPLSHDEVVHGKGSLLGKMPGDDWQRFANLRAYFGFMWGHPGKKLLFMGGEFGQPGEWNHDRGLDWHLLDEPRHQGLQRLVRDLNRLYRAQPALHRRDTEADGFEWVIGDDRANSVFAFLRRGEAGTAPTLVISNLTPQVLHDYRIGVPLAGRWQRLLSTDAAEYGGCGLGALAQDTDPVDAHGRPQSLSLTLPPLATVFLAPG